MHLCQGLTPRSNEPMADSSFSNNKSVDLSRRFAVWRGGVARQGEMRPDVYQLTTPPPPWLESFHASGIKCIDTLWPLDVQSPLDF